MKTTYLTFTLILALVGLKAVAQSTNTSPLVISPATGSYYTLSTPEGTKGTRYLFPSWAKGSATDIQGNLIKDDAYGFNYDKTTGALLFTKNKQTAIEVNRDQLKNFTLIGDDNVARTYEYFAKIDPAHAVQVLSAGAKYKIYKLTKTKFVKANFKTDGMTSSGNNYDEYVDESTYYVVDSKTNTPQKLTLKPKAIKQVFAADADKVNTFLTNNKVDEIDDKFLSDLGAFVNN